VELYLHSRNTLSWRGAQLKYRDNFTFLPSPVFVRVITSRMQRRPGHVAHVGKMRNSYNFSVCTAEEERPLGRLRGRWEDIKRDSKEVE
jgi:hypothetical protein